MTVDALLYWNPQAGRGRVSRGRVERFRQSLRVRGIETELSMTPVASQREAVLPLEGKEILFVWGGDGTLHDLLGTVVRHSVPVVLIPSGTVNVLALELGLPTSEDQLLPLLENPRWRELALGKAGDEYFHLMTGVGFDAYLVSRVEGRLKNWLGVAAYWGLGLTSFFRYPLETFSVKADERRVEATFVVISNVRHYGGDFVMAPEADPWKAELDVCVFTSRSHLRYFYYLWKVRDGGHVRLPDVIYYKTRRIVLEGPAGINYQLDGEVRGHLPQVVEASDKKLKILVGH
ncbi:MAG TPA: diacylglycerol kinase family protein [Acidobacteriota bacterium]|nr:diacylglycerol kinase family protein [Acidobacteriota bacterium]